MAKARKSITLLLAATVLWWSVLPTAVAQPKATKASSTIQAELDINDSIEYPFLGIVGVHSKVEAVTVRHEGGTSTAAVTMSYLPDGRFFQARFETAYCGMTRWGVDELETLYRQGSEELVGIPPQLPKASIQEVLERFCQFKSELFVNATWFDLTYVTMQRDGFTGSKPVFILNVYGLDKMRGSFSRPDDESSLRVRYILDDAGRLMFMDNVI